MENFLSSSKYLFPSLLQLFSQCEFTFVFLYPTYFRHLQIFPIFKKIGDKFPHLATLRWYRARIVLSTALTEGNWYITGGLVPSSSSYAYVFNFILGNHIHANFVLSTLSLIKKKFRGQSSELKTIINLDAFNAEKVNDTLLEIKSRRLG